MANQSKCCGKCRKGVAIMDGFLANKGDEICICSEHCHNQPEKQESWEEEFDNRYGKNPDKICGLTPHRCDKCGALSVNSLQFKKMKDAVRDSLYNQKQRIISKIDRTLYWSDDPPTYLADDIISIIQKV